MSCTHEGCSLPVVNKKHGLCQKHNYIRMHGRSQEEVYAERSASRPKKIYKIKTYAPPRQQTSKERAVKSALSEVKSSIELKAIHDNMYYCWGCGISHPGLDKSHILAVGKRKDLELDPDNMNLFCRDCHRAWESGDIRRMIALLTFEKDLRYILYNDEGYYGVIISKIHHYLRWNQYTENETVRKCQNILKIFGETVAYDE